MELFAYHQDKKLSNDDYSIMFNATVELIKAHGGRSWHHPGLADLHRKQIGKEMVRKKPDLENIPAARRTEVPKAVTEQGNKAVDNEFLACEFILGADNSRYKNLKTTLANRFVLGTTIIQQIQRKRSPSSKIARTRGVRQATTTRTRAHEWCLSIQAMLWLRTGQKTIVLSTAKLGIM